MKNKIAVLGAGIAGISAAYHLKQKLNDDEIIIFEKESSWGGLCGGFYLDSPKGKFWFDNCVHLSFSDDDYVNQIFLKSTPPIIHIPDMNNYYQGLWIKHPAQNNLYPLPIEEKINIIKDMVQNNNKKQNLKNFEEWLKAQYGNYFTEKFSSQYTQKYWTTHPKNLTTHWISNRLYTPGIEEILYGSMCEDTPNTYYIKEQKYPKCGQYRSFLKNLVKKCSIKYHHQVTKIDTKNKILYFKQKDPYQYNTLISSLPLPKIIKLFDPPPPSSIQKSGSKLCATSVAIISLGFNKPDIAKRLWFYVYDSDIPFARVHSPSKKSPANAPKNCSSLQVEIYFSKYRSLEEITQKQTQEIPNFLVRDTIKNFIKMGICKQEDIIAKDFRILPYANVIFDKSLQLHRKKVLQYLKNSEIHSIGRFGKWDYLWSDQSFLSGKNLII
ncbi:FAD-dependent oxidoreductase [Helicobacter sp. 11S03491-1]|uniref:protoporphyrinogen/coproporphyrinogen oxidase n=1 Tax=Helicobacter sp. 11S03491-1 TaxID=1476196 RepID=UPI000BA763C2|nr:FAD-dependent oxidoreductase [Helicobacter sp. 11S03491-1]PAF41220.1 protoporphyrinogen oxidase [Helicobacter sp. 11S03491-1]